jgi:hypothetical protein
MSYPRYLGLTALLVSALVTACSSVPVEKRLAARRAQFESYAGQPVDQFTWLGHYYSWDYVGDYKVVIWPNPFDAYLLTVLPPCEDLPWTQTIGLTSTARTVSQRFDFVLVHAPGEEGRHALPFRCPIKEIRPVDYRRMRHDLRLEAQAPKSAPPSGGT